MPSILALETSAHIGSIALLKRDGEPVCAHIGNEVKHSTWLIPAVRDLFAKNDVTPSTIDAIAYGAGPGAFTGVRTACSAAQALAYAWQKPLLAVDSLHGYAQAALICGLVPTDEPFHVVFDARMNELYCASYIQEAAGALSVLTSTTLTNLADWTARADAGAWVIGSGAQLLTQAGFDCLGTLSAEQQATLDAHWAHGIAQLAAIKLALGETTSPLNAEPHYVRSQVALTEAERKALAPQPIQPTTVAASS